MSANDNDRRRTVALLRDLLLDGFNAEEDGGGERTTAELVEENFGRDSISLAKQRRRLSAANAAKLSSAILEILDLDEDLTPEQRERAAANLTSSFLDPSHGVEDSINVERRRRVASDLQSLLGMELEEGGAMLDPRRDSLSVARRRERKQRAADGLASSILSVVDADENMSASARRRAAGNLTSSFLGVDAAAVAVVVQEDTGGDKLPVEDDCGETVRLF